MAKAPVIQQIAASFAAMHTGLRWVSEHQNFYLLDASAGFLKPLKDDKLFEMIAPYLEAVSGDVSVTKSTFDNFILWLKIKVKRIEFVNTSEIIFNDRRVLNLKTIEFYPWSGQDIFFHIDCDSPKETDTSPIFNKFLNNVCVKESDSFETDEDLKKLVQEMFGYYLYTKIEPPVAFFLVGEGSNGKSTLLSVLEQIVGGDEFVMSNSIENLTNNEYHEHELRFKRLNKCGEEQSKFVKTDKFKAILDGSKIGAKVKFKDNVYFRPQTKHVFATNKMPTFDTIDYGMKRRFKIIPFNRRFLPHEADKTLNTQEWKDSAFAPELPAIVAWAIEGAKRLIANDYVFSSVSAVEEQMLNFEQTTSSTSAFAYENLSEFNQGWAEFISIDRLYQMYVIWCKRNGKKAMSSSNFREDLRRVMKENPTSGWDKKEARTLRGYKCLIKDSSEILRHQDYASLILKNEIYAPLPPAPLNETM